MNPLGEPLRGIVTAWAWPLDLPLDYRSPWWAAVGDHLRAAGCSLSVYDPRLTKPSSVIDVAYWQPRADVRATPSEVNHDFAFPGA
jgi:hypothetical protein